MRGFLLVADQYAPGWCATVDGSAAPILRAAYTFRLTEVPAGMSRVELRYRPTSVVMGAAISAVTAAIVVVVLLRGRHHHA